jgi:type IV secretory pathway VirJ component
MSLSNVFAVLQQYAGGAAGNAADPGKDFDQVAQNASQSHLATGLAGAIRSDATPSFAQTVSTLFANSDPQQKSGILSHLLNAAGPAAANITPQQAQQMTPDAVHDLAQKAQANNPSIIDEASSFYAQHPTLVKALGAGALAMIMSHMSQNQS